MQVRCLRSLWAHCCAMLACLHFSLHHCLAYWQQATGQGQLGCSANPEGSPASCARPKHLTYPVPKCKSCQSMLCVLLRDLQHMLKNNACRYCCDSAILVLLLASAQSEIAHLSKDFIIMPCHAGRTMWQDTGAFRCTGSLSCEEAGGRMSCMWVQCIPSSFALTLSLHWLAARLTWAVGRVGARVVCPAHKLWATVGRCKHVGGILSGDMVYA